MKTLLIFFIPVLIIPLWISAEPITEREGQWHPEKLYWPRTLIDSSQTALVNVRQRIEQVPFSNMYLGIVEGSDLDYSVQSNERKKAWIAKNAAFRFLMEEDVNFADKSLEYLITAQREPYTNLDERYGNLIWDAEILTNLLLAYDFLKAGNYDFQQDEEIVRNILIDITGSLYEDTDWWIFDLVQGIETNYGAKMAGAIGLAAIVFNDHDTSEPYEMPQNWIDFAVNILWNHFNEYQVDDNGGWAEGPYYLRFSAQSFIPFLVAQHNFLNGQIEEYDGLNLPPLILTEQFQFLLDWGIKIRLPNGFRPNFDDSYVESNFYSAMVGQILEHDYLNWDFSHSVVPYNTTSNIYNLNCEVICTWNDLLSTEVEPDFSPNQFLPDAGQMVFRNSWSEDALYMMVLGEHGQARIGGHIHEHSDNTSFILFAYEKLLVMDCGYLSWDDHDLVRYPKNHNLILIDGEGPPSPTTFLPTSGADSFINFTFSTPKLSYGEINTTYQNTDFIRTAAFVQDRFFIINDFTQNYGSHDYEWLLHGNGGGTTGNETSIVGSNMVTYDLDNVKLQALFNCSQAFELSQYEDYHEISYNNAGTHNVTKATAEGEDLYFSVILIPETENSPLVFIPENHGDFISNYLEYEGLRIKTIIKQNELQLEDQFLDQDLIFDGNSLIISSAQYSEPDFIFARNVTMIDLNGFPVFRSQKRTNICLNIFADSLFGFIETGGEISFYTGNEPDTVNGFQMLDFKRGNLFLVTQDRTYFSIIVDWEQLLWKPVINQISFQEEYFTVSWYPSYGATAYEIYSFINDDNISLLTTVVDTFWIHEPVGEKKFFYLKAIN